MTNWLKWCYWMLWAHYGPLIFTFKGLISASNSMFPPGSWVGTVGSGIGSNKEHLRLSSLKKGNTAAFWKDVLQNQTFQILWKSVSKHSSLTLQWILPSCPPDNTWICLFQVTARSDHEDYEVQNPLDDHVPWQSATSVVQGTTLQQIHIDEPKPKKHTII